MTKAKINAAPDGRTIVAFDEPIIGHDPDPELHAAVTKARAGAAAEVKQRLATARAEAYAGPDGQRLEQLRATLAGNLAERLAAAKQSVESKAAEVRRLVASGADPGQARKKHDGALADLEQLENWKAELETEIATLEADLAQRADAAEQQELDALSAKVAAERDRLTRELEQLILDQAAELAGVLAAGQVIGEIRQRQYDLRRAMALQGV